MAILRPGYGYKTPIYSIKTTMLSTPPMTKATKEMVVDHADCLSRMLNSHCRHLRVNKSLGAVLDN